MTVNIKKEFGNNKGRRPDITNLVYGKVPPQQPELEESVLGALLNEPHLFPRVLVILKSADYFYKGEHQSIYKAMKDLHDKSMPIDSLTVVTELRKSNELEAVGGAHYIATLKFKTVSSANIEVHSYLIAEVFLKREMIRISGQVIGDAYEDSSDPFDLMNKVETAMFNLRNSTIRKQVVSHASVIKEVLDESDELRTKKSRVSGVPTGNSDMNDITRGWQGGHVIIVAARPSVGKTAYALSLTMAAAMHNYPVAFFSLETKRGDLVKRMLSAGSGVAFERILMPSLQTPEEQAKVAAEAQRQANYKIKWDDTPSLSLPELRAKALELKAKDDIQLIIIDYLQLMEGDSNDSRNRENEISKISRGIKTLALELNIPIIALSQLNRGVEGRGVRTYKLSDLRESGAIEQDADVVMFLHTPTNEDFKQNTDVSLHSAGVYIEKHRNGKKGKVVYTFLKDIQRWQEFDPHAKASKPGAVSPPPPPPDNNPPPPVNEEDLPF